MSGDPLLDRPDWAPAWIPTVHDHSAMRWLRWVLGAVFFAGLASCVVEGADRPADPVLGEPIDETPAETPSESIDDPVVSATSPTLAGEVSELAATFGTIVVDLVTAGGEVLELCLLDANETAERPQGLKGVTDLEGHDGMLFRWDQDVSSNFVMVDTVVPLTISWWTADGGFVSSTDMEPCTEADAADCTRYGADGPYRFAVEVPQGALPEAGAGARLEPRPERSCQTP